MDRFKNLLRVTQPVNNEIKIYTQAVWLQNQIADCYLVAPDPSWCWVLNGSLLTDRKETCLLGGSKRGKTYTVFLGIFFPGKTGYNTCDSRCKLLSLQFFGDLALNYCKLPRESIFFQAVYESICRSKSISLLLECSR